MFDMPPPYVRPIITVPFERQPMADFPGIQFSPVQERIISWLIIIAGVGCLVTLLAVWVAVIALSFNDLRRELLVPHFVAIVGVPGICATAFLLVLVFRRIEGPIELEAFSFKFRGAGGPIIMWAAAVLTMMVAVKMVW